MVVEIPDELVGRALAAAGLTITGDVDGIARTRRKPGCVECGEKSAVIVDSVFYCAKHARELMHSHRVLYGARSLV